MGHRVALTALATATVVGVLGCGATKSGSTLPALNVATGFIDAVRANDASGACSMTTAKARHDLARLLRQSGAPRRTNVCAQPTIASRKVRAAAMRPFLGILGFTKDTNSGGSSESGSESGSKAIEWSQSVAGRYAVVVIGKHSPDGLLVDSIRLGASCSACG
jgi:hypothetical protein